MKPPVLVGCACGLLALGLWLGRGSSSSSRADAPDAAPAGTAEHTRPAAVATGRTASRPLAAREAPSLKRPGAPAGPGLAKDLADPDPKIRRAATLEAARDPQADPALLLAASRDPDREVGVIATEALGRLHADGQVTTRDLIARATDHALDERVRVSALNGLGLVADRDAADVLVSLLSRGDTTERRTAAILLSHQDPARAMPALIDALADADESVRDNVLESLRAGARGRDFGPDAAAWRAWWASRS